ncbi:hypothetical protein MTR67_051478 [Solanum verrucosum]|uniref:Uncharacterized protein n=1 Tax=Solanum verrucosum TaxID=315347 RepID=A0AAF0V7F7_SOLVR|nr:hypothetical protein MTR67_051478 [Solanum verrucosum]
MLPDVLMISPQVQGPDPLQSMFIQGYMLYSCKAVCVKRLVRRQCPEPIRTYEFENPYETSHGFTPLSKEVST